MVAFAGVGSYGNVLRTKIARSSRRACNFVILKDRWEPAVFSIPIARSTLQPSLANDGELDLDNFDDALQRRKVGGISGVERQSIGCSR
jgi:hypothetical protein